MQPDNALNPPPLQPQTTTPHWLVSRQTEEVIPIMFSEIWRLIRARDLTRYVNLGFDWPGSGGFKTKC